MAHLMSDDADQEPLALAPRPGVEHEGTAAALVKSRIDFEHNAFFRVGVLGRLGEDEFDLSRWKRDLKQDAAAPASRTSDPEYVDAPASDYRLKASSPARRSGVDILDLNGNGDTTDSVPIGAFVTGNERIGIRSSSLPKP